jgi:hypothetical protein
MRTAVLCALLATSCQQNDKRAPPAQQSTAAQSPAGSSSVAPQSEAPPASQSARAALPPLPSPLPGKRQDLTAAIGSAWRAAIGDFDGDRKQDIAICDSKQLRVINTTGHELAAVAIASGIHVLVAADIDGDGKSELLAGWGESRDYRDAKARITIHRLRGKQLVEEVVAEPETTRAEVVAIVPIEKQAMLIGYYDSKFMVTSAIARHGAQGWQLERVASIRMATTYARGDVDGDRKPDLVVGRIYGDDKGLDGDAFVLAPDGSRKLLPTTRGLRSLAIIGGDVYLGDGWHQNYGEHGRGLLTRVHHDQTGFHGELVEDTAGQYAVERILPATVDGKQLIVALGSHYVRVFTRDSERWRGLTVAGPARDIAIGDLDGVPGDEILVVGDKSEVVDLHGVTWP